MNTRLLHNFLKETDRLYKAKLGAYLKHHKRFPKLGEAVRFEGEIYKVIRIKYKTIYVLKNRRRTIMKSQVNLVAEHDHA